MDRIELLREDAVAILLIDHPSRNLVTRKMIRELAAHVAALERDDRVRAAIVTGAGEADFSGGLDMAEWTSLSAKKAQEEVQVGQDALWALEHLSKPTIAVVSGACRGLGVEIALACDVRIAAETSTFSFPEVDVGWMPSHGGTARLSRRVGRPAAIEILLSGRPVRGIDALRLGLVDHLTPPGEALALGKDRARAFASKPAAAARAIKRTLVEGDAKPYRNRFLLEAQHAAQLLWSEEYKDAVARFRGKRP